MKQRMVSLFAGLAAALALPAFAESGVSGDRILLGQAAVFSGPAAQLGIQMRNGIQAYLAHVNAQGGVHGRRIELVTEDDRYEVSVAPGATKKLIEEHKVFALVGYVGTPTGVVHLPVLTQAKVPLDVATALQTLNASAARHDPAPPSAPPSSSHAM